MGAGFLRSSQPGLLDTLGDVGTMGLWELVRAQQSPISLPELAALSGIATGVVQARLDRLVNAGLARAVRARKPRTSVGYVATIHRIVVAFDRSNPEEVARVKDVSRAWERHTEEVFAEQGGRDGDAAGGYRSRFFGIDQLDAADFAELHRRINSVCEFWNMLSGKNGAPDGSGRRQRTANHAITIRVEPIAAGVLANPEMWFRPKEALEHDPASRALRSSRRPLTVREQQVARALATGLQRRQLATHLGVSIHTLTTMCKRIYAKLGVHSQAELAAVMRASAPAVPPA